jgi:ABC-type nitrate/sulfonate/bicarbonate transport system substrate-binding protein
MASVTPRRTIRRVACAVVLGAVVVVGATSAASAQPQNAAGPLRTNDLAHLTVSLGSDTSRYADVYVARYEGFFKKAGVDATISNNGTSYATVALAGRADLALSGASGTFPFITQGRNLRVVYATGFGNSSGFAVKTDSPYHTALDLGKGGVTIGIQQAGLLRGQANGLSNYIVAHGGTAPRLTAATSTSGDFGSLIAGGVIDTSAIDFNTAAPYIQAGKIRWLDDLKPGSPLMEQFLPPGTVGISFWGYADTLASKRDAVVRFITGLRMAERWLATQKDSTIATVLHNSVPSLSQLSLTTITQSLQYDRQVWSLKQEGYISGAAWNQSIPVWSGWNLGYDITGPKYSYPSVVDMSYWNAATKAVNKLYPKKAPVKKPAKKK